MSGLIPEGTYVGKVIDYKFAETENGVPLIRLMLEITGGEFDGRIIHKDLYLSEAAWQRSVEMLRDCGWTGDDITDLSGVLNEQRVYFEIVHEMVTDKNRNPVIDASGNMKYQARVSWVGKPRGPKPLEDDKLARLRAVMKQRLLHSAPVGSKASVSKQPYAVSTAEDDDIPF